MTYGANPYILFLILILLVLGMDPEAGKKIEMVRRIMERMASAMNNFRTGVGSMTTDFEEIHFMLRDMYMPGGNGK